MPLSTRQRQAKLAELRQHLKDAEAVERNARAAAETARRACDYIEAAIHEIHLIRRRKLR